MNLRELIDAFRRDCDDRGDPPLFSDSDIIAWLNEGQEEACIRSRLLLYRKEYAVARGERIIPLDPEVFEVKRVGLRRGGRTEYVLYQTDAGHLDYAAPDWRSERWPPRAFVHRDGEIEISGMPRDGYMLDIEGYRLPCPMVADTDCPEIDSVHHRRLVYWALFRGHSVSDKEVFAPQKAAENEARFDRYFKRPPDVDLRKPQNANLPHRNKCYW